MPWVRNYEDDDGFGWTEPTPQVPGEVYVSDNPVVAELLGPSGEVISRFVEREPIGYRVRRA